MFTLDRVWRGGVKVLKDFSLATSSKCFDFDKCVLTMGWLPTLKLHHSIHWFKTYASIHIIKNSYSRPSIATLTNHFEGFTILLEFFKDMRIFLVIITIDLNYIHTQQPFTLLITNNEFVIPYLLYVYIEGQSQVTNFNPI